MTVETASGPVVGEAVAGVDAFKGVPYAAPPVGDLRWRPPRPARPWSQPLEADDYGASCPQALPVRRVPPASRAAGVSEDCLFLNLWAPVRSASLAPVIVWIHGGGDVDGTASQTFYDGSAFARDRVVLVSFNYRLGRLGFFAHPALTAAAHGEPIANYGLMDQIAALKWVRANVKAFGGDPGRVTVMGESAGGQDILALMASPLARGLFRQAIIESPGGGWGDPPSLAEAEAQGAKAIARAGLKPDATAADLRALPVSALVGGEDDFAGPVLDGRLLPEAPLAAFARGHVVPTPMIVGGNEGEGAILGPNPKPAEIFPSLARDDLAALREAYGPTAADDEAFARLMFRDGYFIGPALWAGEAEAARGAPVFAYRFTHVLSLLAFRRTAATHGSEIPFVFETGPTDRMSPEDLKVAAALHGAWVAFAGTGSPQAADPAWKPLAPGRPDWLVVGHSPVMAPAGPTVALELLRRRLAPKAVRDSEITLDGSPH